MFPFKLWEVNTLESKYSWTSSIAIKQVSFMYAARPEARTLKSPEAWEG